MPCDEAISISKESVIGRTGLPQDAQGIVLLAMLDSALSLPPEV
jgi:hypothetical protein